MTPAQRNAKRAMKLYHSGEASSLKEAWRMVKGGKANPRKRKNTAKRKNFHHNPRNVKLDIKLPNTNLRVVGAGMDANGNSVIRFAIGSNRAFSIQTVGTRMHPVKSDLVHIKKIFAKDLKAFTNAAIKHIKSFGSASQKKSLKVYKNNPRKRRNSAHSDPIAIREILLTVTNDGDFYRQVLQPNLKNLGRHMYRGNFTRAGAMKSFQRIANLADKFYQFNYGTRTRGVRYFGQQKGFMLSASDRKILAAEMLEEQMEAIQSYADEMQAGVKYKDLNNNPHCMPNPRRRKNGMMKAQWSPVNQAWFVFFGDKPISIQGQMTFQNKEELKYILSQQGLKLKSNNDIVADGPNPFSNPRKRKNSRKSNPRRRRNSRAQAKAQSNAKKAMDLYHSGKAKSLKSAWRMVKRGS